MTHSETSYEAKSTGDVVLVEALDRSFFRILVRCGIKPDDLVKMVQETAKGMANLSSGYVLPDSPEHHIVCTDVVFHWRRDTKFLDSKGMPRPIAPTGLGPTFERLVEMAAPGCTSDSVLRYLLALGAVRSRPDDMLELASESVLACAGQGTGVIAPRTVLSHIGGFLGSVEFNVCAKQDNSSGRFERACYALLPRPLLPIFQRLVEQRGQNFVDSIDEWLVRHRGPDSSGGTVQVGAGAYVFLNDSNDV
jgi:hypothetical protein